MSNVIQFPVKISTEEFTENFENPAPLLPPPPPQPVYVRPELVDYLAKMAVAKQEYESRKNRIRVFITNTIILSLIVIPIVFFYI